MEIIVRKFKQGMTLPGQPNSSLPAVSRYFEAEAALHRMSNGELWLVVKRGNQWITERRATEEDCLSFVREKLAFLGPPGKVRLA